MLLDLLFLKTLDLSSQLIVVLLSLLGNYSVLLSLEVYLSLLNHLLITGFHLRLPELHVLVDSLSIASHLPLVFLLNLLMNGSFNLRCSCQLPFFLFLPIDVALPLLVLKLLSHCNELLLKSLHTRRLVLDLLVFLL